MTLYINIENDTLSNTDYRRVIHTTRHDQVVLMSLEPGEDIPLETHKGSQFIRFAKGQGVAIIAGKEYELTDGISLNIPAGVKHYIKQTGNEPLKLYAIYSPSEHEDGLIQPRQKAYIEEVPADILRLTYGYLDDPDLARACLVNKDFNDKLCNNVVWKQRIQEQYGLTEEEIDKYRGSNSYAAYAIKLHRVFVLSPYNYRVDYNRILVNAAEKGQTDIVKIALNLGAYPIKIAFYHARNNKHTDVVKLLVGAGLNNKDLETRKFYEDEMKHLKSYGINID